MIIILFCSPIENVRKKYFFVLYSIYCCFSSVETTTKTHICHVSLFLHGIDLKLNLISCFVIVLFSLSTLTFVIISYTLMEKKERDNTLKNITANKRERESYTCVVYSHYAYLRSCECVCVYAYIAGHKISKERRQRQMFCSILSSVHAFVAKGKKEGGRKRKKNSSKRDQK